MAPASRGYQPPVSDYLHDYGLIVLFGIIALQAMGVGGLPGKTSLVVAGLLAADGYFPIANVVAVAAVAGLVGGYAGYWIGRKGGRRLVEHPRLSRRLARPLRLAEDFFDRHGTKAVFLARFLPGLKVVAAPAAGICCMRWREFALWHALGAAGFALLFGLGAYYAGESAIELAERFGFVAVVPAAAAAALAWLAWTVIRRRRARAAAS